MSIKRITLLSLVVLLLIVSPAIALAQKDECTPGAAFVADVTVPDDTVFDPGESFEKVWRLENSGDCDWGEGYTLTFIRGDQLGAPDCQVLEGTVVAGEAVDIAVEMIAPDEDGVYTSYWQMADDEGKVLGQQVYIRIVVSAAPAAKTPTPETVSADYQPAFGIDYAHSEQYLAQGEQSQISDPTVLDWLRAEEQSLAHLGDIYRWLKSEFTAYSAGGRTIGVVTVDQLLAERRLGGCHDRGLVYAAVARELGYPALMVRADSIAWVEQFQAGEQGPHVGHVFVEVYLDGKWVLIDPTNGWYVEDGYDPANPVIPLRGPIAGSSDEIYGFYVERKGIDTWAFGIHSPAESIQAMDDFARQLNLEIIVYPEYTFQRFAK